jgi:RHS repeat-associated protein
MKKLLLLLSLICFFIKVSAQETLTTSAPNHQVQTIKTFTIEQELEIAKNLKNTSPISPGNTTLLALLSGQNPSPTAETGSTLRFKDIGVNTFTGSMYMPLPIYTLQEGSLAVPVSVNYNGAGMKNQELASWCGAGWSLTAGGSISRMVKGIPDEGLKVGTSYYNGYYLFGYAGNGSSINNDSEPDVFYLNLNGQSYKFMNRHDGQNAKFEFFPDNDIKVIAGFNTALYGYSFDSFTVIMPDGTKYLFATKENTAEFEAKNIQNGTNYPGTNGFVDEFFQNSQTSAWYLSKITSVYGQEINFTYDNVQYSYYKLGEHGKDGALGVCPQYSQIQSDLKINRVFVEGPSLAKIAGVNTKIEFNKRNKSCSIVTNPRTGVEKEVCTYSNNGTQRTDIDSWARYPESNSYSKTLNEILVMENTLLPKDTLIFKFDYGHFLGGGATLPTPYTTTDVGFSSEKRLRLEKIHFSDKTNVRFRYRGDAPSYFGKSRLSFGIDHWGYPNGADGNAFLSGLIPQDYNYPTCINASNRATDPSFNFYGSLDSVIFDKRKTIAFQYELHQADNYRNASLALLPIGGSRIKSIVNKDLISGIETKKIYEYTKADGSTSGFMTMLPNYRYRNTFYNIGSHSSIYDRLLSQINRPVISYNRVTERTENTAGIGLGKSIMYYDQELEELTPTITYPVCTTIPYPPFSICRDTTFIRPEYIRGKSSGNNYNGKHFYNVGNLIKTETFNEAGDTLAVNQWQYSISNNYVNQTLAAQVFKINGVNLGAYSNGTTYNFTQEYYQLFEKFQLNSQTTKTFSQNGLNPLISKVNYVYKDAMPEFYKEKYPGKHNQLVKTENTDSRGQLSEQYIKYPADFDFTEDTIFVPQVCYDANNDPYDCSYDTYVLHVPQSGSQARGIFEFKNANILSFNLETNALLNSQHLGSNYNTINKFIKPTPGFSYAATKSFSSGNIGGILTDLTYLRVPNDTIYRDPTYFLNSTILGFNDYGFPVATKSYGAAQSAIDFDVSKLLVARQRFNIGGTVVDSSSIFYAKRLFGANRTIGVNKLESIAVFDTTFKKGAVRRKLDKDRNILAQSDYFEPFESFTATGISADISKFRSINRMPRIATTILPPLGDSLDVDIAYTDAEGRTLQTKSLRLSPTRKDMIGATPIFDSFGRPLKSILPVNASLSNGSLETIVLAKAQTFYADSQPVSEVTQYEASPMSRAFKNIGPGAAFRPGKEGIQSMETGNFGIQKTIVSNVNVLTISTYAGNQIVKNTSTDENGNKTISFADKEGRMLETWVQVSGDGSQPAHYLKTTYLYDYLSRQVAVIPPKLYGIIPNGTDLLASVYINNIYFNKYDTRGRLVEKHVPDGGWTYAVYNRLGQLVLSQNARHRTTNLWLWSKYGARGQSIMSGTLTQNTQTREQLQTLFDNFIEEKQYEERLPLTSPLQQEGYTVRSFPFTVQAFATTIFTVNYYDDYTWNTTAGLNFIKYRTNRWSNTKSLMTGSKVRRLDNNNWLASAMYYDDKNRLIQSQSENRFGSINQTDVILDFIGQLLENRVIYRKPSTADLRLSTTYAYDHTGRKLSTTHYLNGKAELLASYEYDELGRLISKNLNEASQNTITRNTPVLTPKKEDAAKKYILLQPGTCIRGDSVYSAFIATGLQKVSYHYNVRSQLRGINLKPNGDLDPTKVFAMKLDYHEDSRYFNGLISNQKWKSSADTTTRKYLYDYDKAYRFTNAQFYGKPAEQYNETNTFDPNGNLLTLQRSGLRAVNTYGSIDNLSYNYSGYSNKLDNIVDISGFTQGFKDVPGLVDYTYYPDGSLKTDVNKGITNIIYNYLGLQEEIVFSPTQKIKNIYTSDGQKLTQLLINGFSTTKTEYVGDLIYKNDTLQTIYHDEGRVRFDANRIPHYQYFIQDHLGSNRVIFEKLNDSTYIAQRTDYYAWGSPLSADNMQFKFLYQGKEYIDFLGLNSYDFGWRVGDSWTGRWNALDPEDQFQSISGFSMMANQPTMQIDPDGRVLPLIYAGAALIGGVSNLASNWNKIKGWKQGFAYFASGAIGGALTLVPGAGPAAGGFTTATLNVGIDVATGNIPKFENTWDVAKYAGGLALDGFGVAGAGSLSKLGYNGIKSFFSSAASVSFNGAGFIKTGSEIGSLTYDFAFETVVKPALKGFGNPLASAGLRQGLNKAANLNSNLSKGNFGIYEIVKDGQLYKYGKADLGRITQTSGYPTRIHQQVRKLQDLYPDSDIFGKIVDDLGQVTTKSAKGVENAYLNFFNKTKGYIPHGNLKSFIPR